MHLSAKGTSKKKGIDVAISTVSPEILHHIYSALVKPHFDYCSIVEGNCGKTLSEKLQKLQNRAACILTSFPYDADAGYLLQQLDWKDLITQRQIQVALNDGVQSS